MTQHLYAIIPLRLDVWKSSKDLAADCLNDFLSSNNDLSKLYGDKQFRAYNDNSLCFRTTDNIKYQFTNCVERGFTGMVLLEVSFFSRYGFCNSSVHDHIAIKNVTARQLIRLSEVVRERMSF